MKNHTHTQTLSIKLPRRSSSNFKHVSNLPGTRVRTMPIQFQGQSCVSNGLLALLASLPSSTGKRDASAGIIYTSFPKEIHCNCKSAVLPGKAITFMQHLPTYIYISKNLWEAVPHCNAVLLTMIWLEALSGDTKGIIIRDRGLAPSSVEVIEDRKCWKANSKHVHNPGKCCKPLLWTMEETQSWTRSSAGYGLSELHCSTSVQT